MATDSPRPHPCHGVQNPACSSLSAFPALLALLRLSRLNCLHAGRVLRLEFYALPCGVLPSMPLVVWHAKPGAFLPSHPVPVSASVKQTTTEGQCGQVLGRPIHGSLLSNLHPLQCCQERKDSVTDPSSERPIGQHCMERFSAMAGSCPRAGTQDSEARWPYPLRRPIAFPDRSQFSVPN